MQRIGYGAFLIGVFIVGVMPFRMLYLISDLLFVLIYHVARYRRKVVEQNLRNAFPDKDPKDRQSIIKQFYRHLCDIIMEGIKGFSMTESQILKRHRVINPDLVDGYYEKGRSVIAVSAHYNNWEWGTLSGSLQLKHRNIALYKPLSNKFIDRFLNRTRTKRGTSLVSIDRTARMFIETKNEPCLYIMAADQSPSKTGKAIWIDFLNQDTACIHGPEIYARMFNYPVIYVNIQKVKRGFYTAEMVKLADNPKELQEGELTRLYMNTLEKYIEREPANWLWSHRRWKKKRKIKR